MERREFIEKSLKAAAGSVLLGAEIKSKKPDIDIDPDEIETYEQLVKAIGEEMAEFLIQNPHLIKILEQKATSVEKEKKENLIPVIIISMNAFSVGDYWIDSRNALIKLEKNFNCKVFISNQGKIFNYSEEKLKNIENYLPAPMATDFDMDSEIDQTRKTIEEMGMTNTPLVYIFAQKDACCY